MSNYPPLLQNVIDHLDIEIAQKAFLWAAETVDHSCMKYKAEEYAVEVKKLVLFLRPYLEFSGRAHNASDEVIDDLMRFHLRRHLVWRFGEQRRYWV